MLQPSFPLNTAGIMVLVVLALAVPLHAHGQTIFDDGNDHVVDSDVGQLEIRNGSGVTLQARATGVLVEGGSRLTVNEGSHVEDEVTGPVITVVDSTIEVNDGVITDEFQNAAIDLQGNSTVFLRGGGVGPLSLGDRAEAQLLGTHVLGNGLTLTADGSSHIIMTDGLLESRDTRGHFIGGHVATLNGSASFEMNGGTASSLFTDSGLESQGFHVNENARLIVSGGNLDIVGAGDHGPMIVVSLRDNATASLTGGAMKAHGLDPRLDTDSAFLELSGSAIADVSGVDVRLIGGHGGTGSWSMITAQDTSTVSILDGTYTVWNAAVAETTFAMASGQSEVTINGGLYAVKSSGGNPPSPPVLSRLAIASEAATITIRGGTFILEDETNPGSAQHLEAVDSATIVIYGDNFNYPSGPISELTGTLSGELADGAPLEWRFLRAPTATIELVMAPQGDFNANGIVDTEDIELLNAEILRGTNDAEFDLVEDGIVDEFDRNHWVHSLGNTYFGDANLDGEFHSGDLVAVFQAGHYENGSGAGWAEGDWSGNGLFESGDLVVAFQDGGYEAGPRAATVPEPSSLLLLLIIDALARRRR